MMIQLKWWSCVEVWEGVCPWLWTTWNGLDDGVHGAVAHPLLGGIRVACTLSSTAASWNVSSMAMVYRRPWWLLLFNSASALVGSAQNSPLCSGARSRFPTVAGSGRSKGKFGSSLGSTVQIHTAVRWALLWYHRSWFVFRVFLEVF